MKKTVYFLLLALMVASYASAKKKSNAFGYIIVTDYVAADGKTDATAIIQKLIDENPNRTLYFPDGVYNISKSILTPAHPLKSVQLELSNYARLQAVGSWAEGGAVVRLGAIHKANDIHTPGSNYGLNGGIIDGADVADGISIDGGRETRISNVSIKRTRYGVHIKNGANSGSSDSDVRDVNIVGNNNSDAIGVLIEGCDNSLTNMRIACVNVGVMIWSGGNTLRNIHPLFGRGPKQNYETSCGFVINGDGHNWLDFCYSDQMATGFLLKRGAPAHLTNCHCFWYSGKDYPSETAIKCEGPLNAKVYGLDACFKQDCPKHTVLKADKGGTGVLIHPIVDNRTNPAEEDIYMEYLQK